MNVNRTAESKTRNLYKKEIINKTQSARYHILSKQKL